MNSSSSKDNVSQESLAAVNRYKSAYNQSAKTIRFGEDLKGKIGIVVSSVIALCSLLLSLFITHGSFTIIINGLIGAFIVFAQFYIIGTIILNGGHVHKINIDTAINTSPFLNNELKSQALQLAITHPPTVNEQHEQNDLSFPQVVTEIIEMHPDMELCVKEAIQYQEVNSARFEDLQKSYQTKSNDWFIAKLTKVKGTFRSAYGLMVLEAYRRKINLAEIEPVMPPDELPQA